jgi:hypothetical protein
VRGQQRGHPGQEDQRGQPRQAQGQEDQRVRSGSGSAGSPCGALHSQMAQPSQDSRSSGLSWMLAEVWVSVPSLCFCSFVARERTEALLSVT